MVHSLAVLLLGIVILARSSAATTFTMFVGGGAVALRFFSVIISCLCMICFFGKRVISEYDHGYILSILFPASSLWCDCALRAPFDAWISGQPGWGLCAI